MMQLDHVQTIHYIVVHNSLFLHRQDDEWVKMVNVVLTLSYVVEELPALPQ